MKIWANTIVNNEENFIWFSVMSVVDYVDQVLIYDIGSTDNTVAIIREIQKNKKNVKLKEVGIVDAYQFPTLRQKMLDESESDWILILDGDEIWWQDSIVKVKNKINKSGEELDGIVVPMVVPVGDIYHIQEAAAGQYRLLGRKGHLSLKAINKKIAGLHVNLPYGKEGYFDSGNKLIQNRKNIIFLDAPFLHVTHLKRSKSKRLSDKFKHELGYPINPGFKYPEVFYNPTPKFIPSPWIKLSGSELIISKIFTPLRKIKRRLGS